MKTGKTLTGIIMAVNFAGILCLIYFAVPYLTHDTAVPNPAAMLPAETWDCAGMALSVGLFPLVMVNFLGFLSFGGKRKYARLLCFAPGLLCLMLVISYWFPYLCQYL